ncbi:EUKARYOTIC TRANSLATION INITIATION FACTOR 2-ALPHA KINASE EIF2-ALPHA KINASE -RELATED [Salix purpurea]|uniref:EUKARYOTIC TRANSLATION INITIATION FACTOR 2-ALPHA KINASE EIF2-ALPHA KINASE -RELATED n=1 Tax=Salix purpurea TaxID=77065 RepID=A0A9Q0ZAN0_SALPP|nr:EUKARYOTIC TRANSLATION INITIATION FACTOR 2-ALPHA KINASE EIF2-ALPHA KINASE -RELATED [Salix purpurea]
MVQFYDSDDKDGSYDVSTDDDAPLKDLDSMLFIQMEHCCQNLDHLLEQSTISKGEALKYFREMVRGLDHIHGKKIIHGDLSRKNIFIDTSNVIKVADFSLARLLDNSATAIKSGSSGTKVYLAPEAETRAPINEKIDIYSLGILLLELLGSFTTMFERLVALSPGERPSTREILTWPICADVSSSEAEDDDRVPIRTEDEPRAADDDRVPIRIEDEPRAADDNPSRKEMLTCQRWEILASRFVRYLED